MALEARLEEAGQRQKEVVEEEDEMDGIDMDTQPIPASFMHVASSRKSSGESAETNPLTCQDFSRVLSETLQALEESVCIPPTPGRRSITSSIDAFTFQDLEMAKVRECVLGCGMFVSGFIFGLLDTVVPKHCGYKGAEVPESEWNLPVTSAC